MKVLNEWDSDDQASAFPGTESSSTPLPSTLGSQRQHSTGTQATVIGHGSRPGLILYYSMLNCSSYLRLSNNFILKGSQLKERRSTPQSILLEGKKKQEQLVSANKGKSNKVPTASIMVSCAWSVMVGV